MRNSTKIFASTAFLVASLAVAPSLYAHESKGSGGAMMTPEMMGQMTEMMAGCSKMMQAMHQGGADMPNDQHHDGYPDAAPSPKG
jgi:hypothetical protein